MSQEVIEAEKRMRQILDETEEILKKAPHLDRDNVRHTLILLGEELVERLRRSLKRGRVNIQQ